MTVMAFETASIGSRRLYDGLGIRFGRHLNEKRIWFKRQLDMKLIWIRYEFDMKLIWIRYDPDMN